MQIARPLLGLIAPPCCASCGAPCASRVVICPACEQQLGHLRAMTVPPPRGVETAWVAGPLEGVAHELVVALKFRRLLPVAGVIAARIATLAPPGLLEGALVPVPASPGRRRRRGFDPAELIARELAERASAGLAACLRRRGGPRQVGRPRRQRLADPPRVRAVGAPPERAVLVDDVMTTGSTLGACAAALRHAGAKRVVAVAFARTP